MYFLLAEFFYNLIHRLGSVTRVKKQS